MISGEKGVKLWKKLIFKSFTAMSIKFGHFHSSFSIVRRDRPKTSHFNSETIFRRQKAVITTLPWWKIPEIGGRFPVMASITLPLSYVERPSPSCSNAQFVAAIFSNCL